MNDRIEGHFFVVRYMFDELRDEAANVGVILLVEDPPGVILCFLDDVTAKSRLDARIDGRLVAGFQDWLDREVDRVPQSGRDVEGWLEAFEYALSEITGNVIRVLGPRSVLMTDPKAEAWILFDEWVAVRRRKAAAGKLRDPLAGMRREARGVIARTFRERVTTPAVRRALHKDYEIEGKVHKNRFDLAIVSPRQDATIRLFHHVLILPDAEESYDQAAALARRWIDVREADGNGKALTAVFYSRDNPTEAELPEAARLLRHDHIDIASISKLRTIADSLEPQAALFATPARKRKSGGRKGRSR